MLVQEGPEVETGDVRAVERVGGIAGLATLVVLFAYVAAWSAHRAPDVTSNDAAGAIVDWLHARTGGSGVPMLLVLSALSYVPFIVFLATLRRFVAFLDASGNAASVISLASAAFLAGELVGDASHAIRMALADAPTFRGSTDLVIMFDRVWLVATTEAHVALGLAIATVGIASHRARARENRDALPPLLTWWGIFGLVVVVPVAATGSVDALIATNLVRLSWILAISVVLLKRSEARRRAGETQIGASRAG